MASSVFTKGFTPGRNQGRTSHELDRAPEAANVVSKAGAPLINSSGYVDEAGADPGAASLVGVSAQDGHNSTPAGTDKLSFYPLDLGQEFEGTLSSGGTAVALAQTDLFAVYGIALDATSKKWYIDQSETSANVVMITGFRDPVGTSDARVYFKFLTGMAVQSTTP